MFSSSIGQQPTCASRSRRAWWSAAAAAVFSLFAIAAPALAAAGDVVLYASDVKTTEGNFWQAASSTGANGMRMESKDWGWTADSALASPNDYFEASFSVQPNTPYHVWLRMRGANDSKYNESAWVQFSSAVNTGGSPVYRIGSSSALLVNLENCADCGISGWGWQDGGYWTGQSSVVQFASAGPHTVRVQIREDGVQIDQIVLSPSTYLNRAPGAITNDNTIVSKTSSAALTSASGTAAPLSGTPAPIPGTLQAEGFDNGGPNVAYYDTTSANEGGVYRSDGVDITWASGGTGLVGWVAAGEWLKYTVNVQSAGAYNAEFLVASAGQGGVFHVEMNGTNVSGSITVPDTGGWQKWRTVSARVNLNAGRQTLRLVMDRVGQTAVGNFDSFRFTPVSASAAAPAPSAPSSGSGGQLRVMTWNIRYGTDKNNADAVSRQVALMASQNPDVIILQEVSIYNGDQPSMYRNQLQSATGRTWYTSWAPSCSTGGCLGNLILSRLPMSSQSMIFIAPTAAAKAVVSVGGVPVNVFAAHLDVNPGIRSAELGQLIAWVGTTSGRKILGADLNSWWGETWPQQLVSAIGGDTWKNVTGNQDGGYTIGNVRFDFLFHSSSVVPLNCWVVSTDLSDHRPVVADYRVQ